MADRSAHGAIAGASQLRRVARSDGGGARGAWDGVYAHAVLAEGGELDDQVERRADLLSEPGEHAFGKIGRGPDGRVEFVQVPLHGAPKTGGGRRTPAGRAALPPGGGHPYGEMLDELKYVFVDLATNMFVDLAIRRTREIPARAQALTS